MIVTLKSPFNGPTGARNYPGETIRVSDEVGKRLIRIGAAEAPRRERPAPSTAASEAPRAVEATLDPSSLRGEAKKAWLRGEITKAGGTPVGATITALDAELRALKG